MSYESHSFKFYFQGYYGEIVGPVHSAAWQTIKLLLLHPIRK